METTNVMKSILTILISFGLAFSVFGQTRNVVVGTNDVIVSPTNFWSANASNGRTGLGLGSAATNSSSAFQPSSSVLSNIASSNGVNLTNIQSSNIVGSTTVGNSLLSLANPSAITFLRVNADNTVSSLSASDFRTALNLGTSSTNNSTAFQPSSIVLSNLANSNGVNITNIQSTNISGTIAIASNVSGIVSIANGGTGATNIGAARTNLNAQQASAVLSNLANNNAASLTNITISNLTGVLTTNGNGAGLTNLTAANITGTVALASNVTGTIAISNGGTGATNAATARTNLGLDSTNNAFSSLSVGVDITNSSTSSDASSAFGRQITIDSTVENSIAVGFDHSMSNFGLGAGGSVLLGGRGVMTNWGAFLFNGVEQGGTIGYSKGNSTFAVIASNGIYLDGPIKLTDVQGAATDTGILQISAGGGISRVMTNKSTATPAFFGWNGFSNLAFSIAESRTNLGLAWSALTNSNAGTGLVSVNTNGEVVSPTNFWQVAPIQTLVQSIIPVINSTNAATNARNLYIYSLATNVVGVTNTITLPTNSSTFNGDAVTITHEGTTSSVTAIRQLGSATNFTTISNFAESVKFIRESDQWGFYHNISYVEPIRFTDGAIEENKAVSRTNLGLGFSALTNTNAAGFQRAIFSTNSVPSNSANINTINFNTAVAWMEVSVITNGATNSYRIPLFQ